MSKRARETAEIVDVPQSRSQVVDDIREIGRLQRDIKRLDLAKAEAISAIEERYATESGPLKEAKAAKTHGVRLWCEVNRNDLTQGGKVKTGRFETGEVRWRMDPPSVTVKGTPAVLDQLHRLGLERFIRVNEAVNREAVLEDPAAVRAIKGLSITQDEKFEVIPFEAEPEKAAV